jgi:predicted  nucleic acid-binding Zn-ribbon protein
LKDEITNSTLHLNSLAQEFEKIKEASDAKDKNIETLNLANDQKDREISELNEKILELEESIGEQEEEHQEMVKKLAQSLDSLANRKMRKKKSNAVIQEDVEYLGKNLESTRI